MRLAIIVAQAENRVIGTGNRLPWRLPEDLRYFKQVTWGKSVIMGRRTFESIGRPLAGRTNLVISRQADYRPEGVEVLPSLDAAIERAEQIALIDGTEEAMVIGGAQIYAEALPRVERLYLTQVHARVEGDAFFPPLDPSRWREISREDHAASGCNPYDYSFIVLERC